jgi:hypothetical protein
MNDQHASGITSRGGVSFFSSYPPLWIVLARAAAGPTANRRTCMRLNLAKTFYLCLLQNMGAIELTSELRSSGEIEAKMSRKDAT